MWTTVAGPLVNVALAPILVLLVFVFPGEADFNKFVFRMASINLVILVFNLLPIFPLDGGRILQAVLWKMIGLPRSLIIAGCVGMLAGAGLLCLAVAFQELLLGAVAAFLIFGAFNGVKNGRNLGRLQQEYKLRTAEAARSGSSQV